MIKSAKKIKFSKVFNNFLSSEDLYFTDYNKGAREE